MILLIKAVAAFLFPPGLIVSGLVALGVWCRRSEPGSKPRKAAVLLFAGAAAVYLLSTQVVGNFFTSWLEFHYPPLTLQGLQQADCYVLLGGGVNPEAPASLGGTPGQPSEVAGMRVAEVCRLYRVRPLPVIACGGAVFPGDLAEALVLRSMLISLGVPPGQIFVEGQSRTTGENAERAGALCRLRGWLAPVLVTSALHMPRAVRAFERAGLKPHPAPCAYWTNRRADWLEQLLPDPREFYKVRAALWEYAGLIVGAFF